VRVNRYTQYAGALAVEQIRDATCSGGTKPIAIIGPMDDDENTAAAVVTSALNIVHIPFWSRDPDLADLTPYPTFLRTSSDFAHEAYGNAAIHFNIMFSFFAVACEGLTDMYFVVSVCSSNGVFWSKESCSDLFSR
jgi:hypothetical protein